MRNPKNLDDATVSSVGLDGYSAAGLDGYSAALRRSFQLSPVATSISRVEDGRILDANEAYCALFGYTRAELVGRSMSEMGLIAEPLARAVRASAERIDTRLQDYDFQ